ncbi:hypothetical protein AUI06_08345 [archaeon 13_2_20CM_2_52_21]|nr:MAG: hypothetical protein AUI06_08345 [archaeon 13_2_20CM_2_52_21]
MFSWTPVAQQAGSSYDLTIIVSDGILSDRERTSITVPQNPSGTATLWAQYEYMVLVGLAVAAVATTVTLFAIRNTRGRTGLRDRSPPNRLF